MSILSIVTVLLLVVVLGLKFRYKTAEKQPTVPQSDKNDIYVKGVLVVGFKKEVSQTKTEGILNGLGLKFSRTNEVNMGMKFHSETGEKFLVRVPDNEEFNWLDKLTKITEVKDAGRYIDPEKVLVD